MKPSLNDIKTIRKIASCLNDKTTHTHTCGTPDLCTLIHYFVKDNPMMGLDRLLSDAVNYELNKWINTNE